MCLQHAYNLLMSMQLFRLSQNHKRLHIDKEKVLFVLHSVGGPNFFFEFESKYDTYFIIDQVLGLALSGHLENERGLR